MSTPFEVNFGNFSGRSLWGTTCVQDNDDFIKYLRFVDALNVALIILCAVN